SGGSARLMTIHRANGPVDFYFVSNQKYVTAQVDCLFRVRNEVPELWYPDTGRSEVAADWRETANGTVVPLRLDPAGSVFVVFRPRRSGESWARIREIPAGQAATAPKHTIQIVNARYEPANGQAGGADVTAKVAAMVANGNMEIPAT